jgi:multidrug resistance efflux pump
MTWASRIRLLVGTLVVLVLAAVATYNLNESKGVAASDSAQILAKTYEVGTPYAGLVVDQMVDVGDAVTKGQPLFVIESASLQYDITNRVAVRAEYEHYHFTDAFDAKPKVGEYSLGVKVGF